MDTSEQYIKMCDCDEIQGTWELKEGDLVYWPSDPSNIEPFAAEDVDAWTIDEIKKEPAGGVWLPRRDQSLDMLGYQLGRMIDIFCEWIDSAVFSSPHNSMEQIWLAFVMHEKFNKKWNGEKWEETQ
jgi:hypothetical protein